jgi:hypothetical protein
VEYLKLVFEKRTFHEININLTKAEHEKFMHFLKNVVKINELYSKIYKIYDSKEIQKQLWYTISNFSKYDTFIDDEIRILRHYSAFILFPVILNCT